MTYNTVRKTLIIVIAVVLSSCSATKKLTTWQNEADSEYQNQNYESALEEYKKIIDFQKNAGELPKGTIYNKAGLSAYKMGKNELALSYLSNVRNTSDATAETYYTLAEINRGIDNLSREISALENYVDNFPEGEKIIEVKTRLFETCKESTNYELAVSLWDAIKDSASGNEKLFELYFHYNTELENEDKLEETAEKLLEINPDNITALEYKAEKLFWKAENRYQKEMKAYEKNRTRKQYRQLLKAFDILNADFRTSLKYYLQLYDMNPEKEYARYIGNIYLRFDDKSKARYYHDKAGI